MAYSEVVEDLEDFSLEAKIMAMLRENKITRDSDIHVHANNGIVTVSGHMASPQKARQVQCIVSNVYGVKGVKNALTAPNDEVTVTRSAADSVQVAQPSPSGTEPAEKSSAP